MPTFNVTVRRMRQSHVVLEIEAADADSAAKLAENKANETPAADWDFDEEWFDTIDEECDVEEISEQ